MSQARSYNNLGQTYADERPIEFDEQTQLRALRTICNHAGDADEARQFAQMVGLLP